MEDLRHTKRRLVREAIQHNVERSTGTRTSTPARPRRVFPVLLWGALLVVNLAYLASPSRGVSTNTAALLPPVSPVNGTSSSAAPLASVTPVSAPVTPVNASAPIVASAPTPEIPSLAPRPLLRSVLPLSVKRVVIDPGHGGDNTGAISASGVSEKEITLDIGLRLRRLLEKTPFDVLMTRDTDRSMRLEDRVAFANTNHADVFVSIHINWLPPKDVRPLETYYVGPTNDPAALRLASLENRDSGYSLADYRRLLEQVFIDGRRDESRRLARTIHDGLYRSLKALNPALENRGVKMAPFVVLVGTEMPAILVEVSCLSNNDEVSLLLQSDYREQMAAALAKGIRSYARALNVVDKKDR